MDEKNDLLTTENYNIDNLPVQDIDSLYLKDKIIDIGAQAKIYVVIRKKDGRKLIIKTSKKKEDQAPLVREYVILNKISNFNQECSKFIVCVHDIFKNKDSELNLVEDYYTGYDLKKFIEVNDDIPEDQILRFFTQLIEAVMLLHKNDIVHRDIKLANIMLENNNIKLIDFGMACTKNDSDEWIRKRVGTPNYMSPEILRRENHPLTFELNKKIDIWACGIVLYFLLFGTSPYFSAKTADQIYNFVKSEVPIYIPEYKNEKITSLLTSILNKNYKERPSAEKIYSKLLDMI